MNGFCVRSYRARDRDAVVDLLAQLVASEGKPVKPRILKLFLRKVARNGGGVVLVAEANGEIIGTAGGYVVGPTGNVDGERYGFIEFVVVDERYRRHGVGSSLVRELITRLAMKGADEIYLEVDPKNEAAMRLYSSLGFSVSYVTMRLDVTRSLDKTIPSELVAAA